jgi:hypothetical protein
MLTHIPIQTNDPKIRECYIEVGDTWDREKHTFPSRFVIEFVEPVDRVEFRTEVAAELAGEVHSVGAPTLRLVNVFPAVENAEPKPRIVS